MGLPGLLCAKLGAQHVLGPDGFSRTQTSKEISLTKGGGSGGASGASRPQPLGHQALTFALPSAQRGSSPCNEPCSRRNEGKGAGGNCARMVRWQGCCCFSPVRLLAKCRQLAH